MCLQAQSFSTTCVSYSPILGPRYTRAHRQDGGSEEHQCGVLQRNLGHHVGWTGQDQRSTRIRCQALDLNFSFLLLHLINSSICSLECHFYKNCYSLVIHKLLYLLMGLCAEVVLTQKEIVKDWMNTVFSQKVCWETA